MSVVISVRVRREIKELLESEGINIAEEVRRFLEELAYKIRIRKYVEKWDRMLEGVKPSPKGFSVSSVREDRESH
jgi:siroheme synthase (precorrin-2 oxidase/ferrochelatase)